MTGILMITMAAHLPVLSKKELHAGQNLNKKTSQKSNSFNPLMTHIANLRKVKS